MKHRNKPVRIGIDIRDLRVAKTGQKTVTEELCKQFRAMNDPEIEFVFFDSSAPIYSGQKKWRIIIEHLRYQCWKQVQLPWKAWRSKCDVLFCGDYFVPFLQPGFNIVEIFYDAFFFEYPQHYPRLWLKLFHTVAMPAARRCKRIMTITDYSKQRLHELAGFPMEKLVTVYPSYKTSHTPANNTAPHGLPIANGRKYILHVGVMEKRKNLPALVRAFHLLTQKGYDDIDLVLVGQGNGKIYSDDSAQVDTAIRECGIEHRVIRTGYLPDEAVGPIYRNAFFYMFPSVNEGFGIPILEAFRFQVPVAVANNSCLPEVGGDAVLSFDPHNLEHMCTTMQQLADNESLRHELIRRGNARLPLFTWEKAAADLAAVLKQAAPN